MKFLALSDIHGQFGLFPPASFGEADAALVCGDLTNLGMGFPAEVAAATQWMEQMAARYGEVLCVLGNHDLRLPDSFFAREEQGIHNITRKPVMLGGFQIVGADLSPCFASPELADVWERMTVDPDVDAAYFGALPAADIVVSHSPPYGLRDEQGRPGSRLHLGSPGLRRYIEEKKPRLVVCGHIHEGSGETTLGNTKIINVARRCHMFTLDKGTLGAEKEAA